MRAYVAAHLRPTPPAIERNASPSACGLSHGHSLPTAPQRSANETKGYRSLSGASHRRAPRSASSRCLPGGCRARIDLRPASAVRSAHAARARAVAPGRAAVDRCRSWLEPRAAAAPCQSSSTAASRQRKAEALTPQAPSADPCWSPGARPIVQRARRRHRCRCVPLAGPPGKSDWWIPGFDALVSPRAPGRPRRRRRLAPARNMPAPPPRHSAPIAPAAIFAAGRSHGPAAGSEHPGPTHSVTAHGGENPVREREKHLATVGAAIRATRCSSRQRWRVAERLKVIIHIGAHQALGMPARL